MYVARYGVTNTTYIIQLAFGFQYHPVTYLQVADRKPSRPISISGLLGSALSYCSPWVSLATRGSFRTASRYPIVLPYISPCALMYDLTDDRHDSQSELRRPARSPSPAVSAAAARRTSNTLRPRTPSQAEQESELQQRFPSPTPQSQLRTRVAPQPASPSNYISSSLVNPRDVSPARTNDRPPSVNTQSQQGGLRPKQSRRPSNADVTALPFNPQSSVSRPRAQDSPENRQAPDSRFSQFQTGYPTQPLRSRPPSPTASDRARKQSSRGGTFSAADAPRREQNTRVSFYDPVNQAALDRLISGGGLGINSDGEGEDENTLATMSNVEEMIEGYEWASDDVITRKSSRGAADLIEARLLDELMALDKVRFIVSSLNIDLIFTCRPIYILS